MHRRTAVVLLPGLAAAVGLGGCGRADRLRLGTHDWIGHEPLRQAHDFGWLDQRVELRVGRSASDSLLALQRGELDGATLTLDETLSARAAGVPLKVVVVLDISAGADMVVAQPDITRLTQLASRRIAVERTAVGELMLVQALGRGGLKRTDVVIVPMPVDAQPEAWRQRRIDAAVTYEPTASRLLNDGAVRLFDSRQLPETIFDVLAVRRDVAAAQPSLVRAAVAAHLRGLAHLRANRADMLYRAAARQNISLADVSQALAGVSLPDLFHNRALLDGARRLESSARALVKVMVQHQLLTAADTLDDALDASFLPTREPAA